MTPKKITSWLSIGFSLLAFVPAGWTYEWESGVGTSEPKLVRGQHVAIYNPKDNSMLVYGGGQFAGADENYDVWKLSLTPPMSWSKLTTTGTKPPATFKSIAVYNSQEHSMILHGHHTDPSVWVLALGGSTPNWTRFGSGAATLLGARIRHTAVYNPVENSTIAFIEKSGKVEGEVWRLAGNPPAWGQVTTSGLAPTGRSNLTSIYNSSDHSMVLYGWEGSAYDVWKLALSNMSWTRLAPVGVTLPEARIAHTAIYNPVDNAMIVIGGSVNYDIWSLSLGPTLTWSQPRSNTGLTLDGVRLSEHTAVYNSQDHAMVVYGGKYTAIPAFTSDTHVLNLAPFGLHSVRGKVSTSGGLPVSGITLTASASGGGGSAVTFENGAFNLTLARNQIYTVTPVKPGYIFSPAAITLTNLLANITGQNFTTTTYTLAGTVTDPEGSPLHLIKLSLVGLSTFTATTDLNGKYEFFSVPPGSYTLTPSRMDYVFFPGRRGLSLSTHESGQDFKGFLPGPFQVTSYQFERTWGGSGSGNGQFSSPAGVAVNLTGAVVALDSGNARTQQFTKNGDFLLKWGSSGAGIGQLNGPGGLDIDPAGLVYVADTANHRIQKFNAAGTLITLWGSSGSGNGQFNSPKGVVADPGGNVYVADTGNHRIQKFSPSGVYLTQWGSSGSGDGQFSSPNSVAVDHQGNVFVADTGNHRIQKFNGSGTLVTKWGSQGNGNGQLSGPYGLSVDPLNFVYVADTGNHRIQKFTAAGTLVAGWGIQGSGDAQFSGPKSVILDTKGNVFVADTGNHRIQKFLPANTIAGTVKDPLGLGLAQVTLLVTGASTLQITSAVDGSFAFTLVSGRNYHLSVRKPGFGFSPPYRNYLPLASNLTLQNFSGFRNTITPQSGGTVTWATDSKTKIQFPPNGVTMSVNIRIQSADEVEAKDLLRISAAGAKSAQRILATTIRNFTMEDDDGVEITSFEKAATLELPYTDDDDNGIVDGTAIKVDSLKVLRLHETLLDWIVVSDGGSNTVDKTRKVVTAEVKHFSLYTVGQATASDLTALSIFPNPVNFATAVRNTVKFDNLSPGAAVKIFDLKGRLVKNLPVGSTENDGISGRVEWSGRNEQGEAIAPGLYFFLITDTSGNKRTGKLAVTD